MRGLSLGTLASSYGTTPAAVPNLAAWYGGGGPLWQDAARTVAANAGDPVRVLDDRSGLGNHAVAPSGTARGQVDTYSITGAPSVYLDGIFSQYTLPSSVSYNVQNYSVFLSIARLGAKFSQALWGTVGNGGTLYLDENGVAGTLFNLSAGGSVPLSRATVAVISRPTGFQIRVNGVAATGVAVASSAQLGGFLGASGDPSSLNAQVILSEAALYSRGVTDAEAVKIEAYLANSRSFVGRFPTDRPLVAFVGNSMTYGVAVTNQNLIYSSRAIRSLSTPFVRHFRHASSGITTTQLAAPYLTAVKPTYAAGRTLNVLVLWELTNDIGTGATGTQAFNNYKSYCQTARTDGWQGLVVLDCLDRQQTGLPAGFETERLAANAALAAEFTVATGNPRVFLRDPGSTFPADALVKVSQIANLLDSTNATYYDSLHVHPTDAGHALIAPDVAAALVTLGVSP